MLKAAIIVEGKMFTGHSHADAILNADSNLDFDSRKSGFVTDEGEFLSRQEAFVFARENGLIGSNQSGYKLQSWMLN